MANRRSNLMRKHEQIQNDLRRAIEKLNFMGKEYSETHPDISLILLQFIKSLETISKTLQQFRNERM